LKDIEKVRNKKGYRNEKENENEKEACIDR